MANEISFTASLSASKGGASINSGSLSKFSDMAGVDLGGFSQAIGTSAEALNSPADVGYPAHVLVKNNDSTNFITIYEDSGGTNDYAKIYPGQFALIPNAPAVPYLKADTAACQIMAWVCEV